MHACRSTLEDPTFPDAGLAPHLSAIVREPVRTHRGERAVPAIELWTGRELARSLLRGAAPGRIRAFCRAYARVMTWGPALFALQYGLAFEPHLQNSIIVLQDGLPARLILRDLDGTLMDPQRVPPLAHELGLIGSFAEDTWEHMPPASAGEHRLVHAMFFAHLGLVVDFLASQCGGHADELLRIVAEEWLKVPDRMQPATANRFEGLSAHLRNGKSMLMARLTHTVNVPYIDLPNNRVIQRPSMPFWKAIRARA